MKLLLLEDDEFICQSIKNYFELDGNKVDYYLDGESLLENAILENYDIFLFDINTPKKNGFETLKNIREDGIKTPAIYITAQNDISHVQKAYSLGCNDYIRKPFILEELELRINQILYKTMGEEDIKLTKNYKFNLHTMQLFFKNNPVDLSQQEKELLYILVKNIGTIMNPEIIKYYVWDGSDICDNTLRTKIKKIRGKLEENFIINIRNSGYKIEKYD
ncbi:response regulator transcription factor [uncultured Arcobacter sp.]|uniref:response regulator transcription factor n=1 Tax=uncultured Arcobacter sp. TaxID=165434 RepID=UPI00260937A8|nr:response regulator transcription factor [uncultured Arcobacter sp.]